MPRAKFMPAFTPSHQSRRKGMDDGRGSSCLRPPHGRSEWHAPQRPLSRTTPVSRACPPEPNHADVESHPVVSAADARGAHGGVTTPLQFVHGPAKEVARQLARRETVRYCHRVVHSAHRTGWPQSQTRS